MVVQRKTTQSSMSFADNQILAEPLFKDSDKVVRTYIEHLKKPPVILEGNMAAFLSQEDRKQIESLTDKIIDQILFECSNEVTIQDFKEKVRKRFSTLMKGHILASFIALTDKVIEDLEEHNDSE